MNLKNQSIRTWMLTTVLVSLVACKASGSHRAPVEERETPPKKSQSISKKSTQRDQDSIPQFYVIQKGDTLYSIAFEHGLDYREVAEQNNIDNPSAIQIGQKIKLIGSDEVPGDRPRIEVKPLNPVMPQIITKKDQPKIAKLPYSELAIIQIEKIQNESVQAPVPVVATPIEKPVQEAESGNEEVLEWGMPTKGKLIGEYSESASRKGVDIAGVKGQVVLASAAGKVVYSGSGLRGYGKLVIIKHNKTYLSAYAHNEQILVKEGQSVSKGQKIAEMGNSDAEQVKLHFEIRKFGKPVDPAKFLNFVKS